MVGEREHDLRRAERLLGERRFAEARELFQQVVVGLEQEHGPDSPELIRPLMGLATATGADAGTTSTELESEVELQTRALSLAERQADRKVLLGCLYRHGVSLSALSRLEDATRALLRALDIAREIGVTEHAILQMLVAILSELGRRNEALRYAKELYALIQSDSDPDTVSLFFVGKCFFEAGETDLARTALREFLAACGDTDARRQVERWLEQVG